MIQYLNKHLTSKNREKALCEGITEMSYKKMLGFC